MKTVMKYIVRLSSMLFLWPVFGGWCFSADARAKENWPVAEVPAALQLSDFYRKHVSVGGFSIVSSEKVHDAALREAAYLIEHMLPGRADILQALAKNHVRFAIMSQDEFTTTIPEHRDLAPADYWDRRARGLGASPQRPAVTCGEENLLCFPGDPYSTENILIHEFGHAIHLMGLNTIDESFDERLRITYAAAMNAGLWKEKYAATNKEEYWAEGVQSWFGTNRENDHDHNHVNTRDEIKQYDPRLAQLLKSVFGDGPWRYSRPAARRDNPHLADWRPEENPTFKWPAKMVARYDAFQQAARGEPLAPRAEDWKDTPSLALSQAADIRSQPSSTPATLLLVNRTEQTVHIDWIDAAGRRSSRGTVLAGKFRLQETYVGHVFLATGGNKQPLGLYRVEKGRRRAIVKTPTP